MTKIKSVFHSHKAMKGFVLLLFIIQPLIDLDYLIYPFLDQFGIPRPSTIIRFLIIPLAVLWTFFLADENKKKTLLFGVCTAWRWQFIFCCISGRGSDLQKLISDTEFLLPVI